ncbi:MULTISPECIES: electron transfer flavoprotein subunit beta/FixA family protein [Clostridium]|jgi:electron transfer flavoprotein beta subunit|uniref:Electron transfer flavoprotein small subunit n=2 Tax=Clostridium TaxID=1485 RepID=A0A7X5PCT0_CLOSG|nr:MULTISPECIES: electron transfer flavoprotein subunit beta/FixA family protein [Clostridium]AJD32278.1 electron transfer flavodomain protein [Clostridium botulinum Prevot_594]AVP62013.1 electron transfer flavoprotein subunit beta/FixA family protein [Clostridium botulinum]AKC64014.1 electron transfer flavoprotein subunit beta [Clostridium sporogenes]AKJ91153.1 electron transfer flavoprotein subunit beta [Clostridium sporogenes]AVP65757.1 electron transfer flavoprotein subunit beta/FixA famil
MNIVVCLKQVPDTNEVKIDPVKGTLIREGVPSIINPDDKNALEEALVLKESKGGKVTVISMGPPQAKDALREALAMGADEVILISDRAFAGADTLATSYALATAVKKLDYDIIFAGRQAIDGDTAQVGPEMAEHLNIPQVTYVEEVKLQDEELEIKKALEDGYEVVSVKMPVLLTAIKDLNTPRYMHMAKIVECCNKEIKVWNADDIGADKSLLGLSGSPTKVKKSVTKETKRDGILVNKPFKEAAQYAISKLKEKHYI